jgi:hypothetical protein
VDPLLRHEGLADSGAVDAGQGVLVVDLLKAHGGSRWESPFRCIHLHEDILSRPLELLGGHGHDGRLRLHLTVQQQDGAFIDWSKITGDAEGIKSALEQCSALGATGLNQDKVTTLQANLDQLIPGLAAVLLTLLCCKLLKKHVSPIVIIIGMFAFGIFARWIGLM